MEEGKKSEVLKGTTPDDLYNMEMDQSSVCLSPREMEVFTYSSNMSEGGGRAMSEME